MQADRAHEDQAKDAPAMRGAFVKIFEPRPGIRVLKLDRPERLNAWHEAMRHEMAEAIEDLALSDVRVAIVCGNERAFSAGEDVRGMGDLSAISTKKFRAIARQFHDALDGIEALEIPVIAAIEGVAAGGGFELALSCDFRVVGRAARLGLPEMNVGLIPGSGGCSRLVRLVGIAKAKEILMLDGMMAAERAHAHGLVTRLVEAGRAYDQALQMAAQLVEKAPLALGVVKLVLNACADVELETGRRFERLGQSVLKKSQDHAEGVQAFVDKRKPNWKDA